MNLASGTVSGTFVSIFALTIGLALAGCDDGNSNTSGTGGDTGPGRAAIRAGRAATRAEEAPRTSPTSSRSPSGG